MTKNGKLKVKSGDYDVTGAMKHTSVDGGFKVELDEAVVATVDGEDIPVCPELASGNGETPFAIKDGRIVFLVKAIPGLKYEVLASETLSPEDFQSAGVPVEATSKRHELTVTREVCKAKGFCKIRVGR